MKILFPCIIGRTNGIEKWWRELSFELKKDNKIFDFPVNKISSILLFPNIFKTDIIHSYNESILSIVVIIIGKLFGKKIIHTFHGDFYKQQKNKTGLKKIFFLPVNKFLMFFADKITFPTLYLKQTIVNRNPYINSKSYIVPNGIDFKKIRNTKAYSKKEIGIDEKTFLITEVTNFNYYEKAKGVSLLVKAFNKFSVKKPDSKLIIIGDGKFYSKFKDKYSNKKVLFLGYRLDVIEIIKASDLFVHISFLDSFAIVALESIACRIPTIISKSCGITKVVNLSTGLVSSTVDDIYKKMFKFYGNPDELNKLVRTESNLINRFSIEKISQIFIKQIYE